ncbi:MAG: neutral zinc metallopeptidase [Chloroflexota bacterium]
MAVRDGRSRLAAYEIGRDEGGAPTFNPNVKLDAGQVEDARGRRMGGGMVIGGGGGIVGLIVIVAVMLLSGQTANPDDLNVLLNQQVGQGAGQPAGSPLADVCKTGADANARQDCAILGYVNSVQAYWTGAFKQSGETYQPVKTVFFSGAASTGCGTASAEVGPFYCPNDKLVWIDLGFFNDLHTKFGAEAGRAAQAYVIAHEYGHHVQDLLGVLDGGTSQQGATGQSVRTELQADCYAGVWAKNAADTGYLQPLTKAQIADALDAASAVGDDRIQERYQGRVTPESWTHGSSAQRQKWFTVGYNAGDPGKCDTFSGGI